MKILGLIKKLKNNMKVLGFVKDNEHVITCPKCGAIIKFSDEEIISEDKCDVDYFGVDRWTEESIVCKSCDRKIRLR